MNATVLATTLAALMAASALPASSLEVPSPVDAGNDADAPSHLATNVAPSAQGHGPDGRPTHPPHANDAAARPARNSA